MQYAPEFYDLTEGSLRSAKVVVPLIMAWLKPASVLDVGCGIGAWLSVFAQHGVNDHLGMDVGDVDRSRLLCAEDAFRVADLTRPINLQRRFDLAVCLEVGEHLAASAASSLVASIASHSDAVLFSAAVPGQGGIMHVNEQWPEYWTTRFEEHGFELFDILRPTLWEDRRVEWCYRQNIVLLCRGQAAQTLSAVNMPRSTLLNVAHPELTASLHALAAQVPHGVRPHLTGLRRALLTAMRRRLPFRSS